MNFAFHERLELLRKYEPKGSSISRLCDKLWLKTKGVEPTDSQQAQLLALFNMSTDAMRESAKLEKR